MTYKPTHFFFITTQFLTNMSSPKHEHPDNTTVGGAYDVENRDVDELEDEALEREVDEAAASSAVKRERDDDNGDDDDDDEDDDDEDGDEDDDDDDEISTSKPKRKRRRANQFLDIEAEVDDEEEDEDEEDEEAELLREQFISDDRDVPEDPSGAHQDDRLHRQYDRRQQEQEDQDAEELAQTLKQRYRKTHTVYRGDSAQSGTVSQKLLMPSINDPSIYAVRCSPGREKDLVRKLYEKKRTLERQGKPLDILTVFQRDSFKGYVYIEAKRPDAIDRALVGMVNIYVRDKLLVPVKEYPDLLKQVMSSDVEIVPGIYVRISRGKYKNDLAIVDNLSENGLDVRCKLVPRLDYHKNGQSKLRPAPRLFSEQDAKTYDGEHLQARGPRHFYYRGEEYQDGFLYKDFKLQFIQTKDVHPRLEELDRFQGSEEDGFDLATIAALLKGKSKSSTGSSFQPGDSVEIRRGEQAKTVGKVIETSIREITLVVTDLGDPNFVNKRLTVPASDLRKLFREGDHVRVAEGKHFDETGLVIKVDGDLVVLVSDQTKEDVRVFANYLVKASDLAHNVDVLVSPYEIKDLVALNALTVGVIVKAEKNAYEVLTLDLRLLQLKLTGISSKVHQSRREQIATDANGFTIRVGDTVRESLGDKKREGVIIHIYKNLLFVKLNEITANLGIFVTNRMNVSTVTTKDLLGPDLTRMNPNIGPAPIVATAGRTGGGRDRLLYKDVTVTSGTYKGLMGKVTDSDDIYARIELHTKSKKIKVPKLSLNVIIRGEAIPYLRFSGNSGPREFTKPSAPAFSSGGRSAWNGGATPAVGGALTWGGKTPAYNGGKTPAAGGVSTWGGGGGASAWGGGGGASTWNSGGGSSSWGGNGGNSSWGKNGGGSTWGKGGGSSWEKGGESTWGKGGNSSWKGGESKRGGDGDNLSWGNRGKNLSWGNRGQGSSWGGGSSWSG